MRSTPPSMLSGGTRISDSRSAPLSAYFLECQLDIFLVKAFGELDLCAMKNKERDGYYLREEVISLSEPLSPTVSPSSSPAHAHSK